MKIYILFIFYVVLLSSKAFCDLQHSTVEPNGDQVRTFKINSTVNEQDPHYLEYQKYFHQFNPVVPFPYSVIEDHFTYKGQTIYTRLYHTGEWGLRITPTKRHKVEKHFIMAGDSNMFGVGLEDHQTLAAQIAQQSTHYYPINLGLGGTSPNSVLFFLQKIGIDQIIKERKKGIMIYDFHYYLFERIIGAKSFIEWSPQAPRFELVGEQMVYQGIFGDYWRSKLYLLLNSLPFGKTLFPNLPQIHNAHIEFAAKLFKAMKKEYLNKSDPSNRFLITLNPRFIDDPIKVEHIEYFKNCLKKEGVEFMSFDPSERTYMPQIEHEFHLSAEAQKHYGQLIFKKVLANQ